MKWLTELALVGLLAGVLAGSGLHLGTRVFWLATGFSVLWFVVSMILLHRPPGVPRLDFSKDFEKEDILSRRELMPKLPLEARVKISLCISVGVSLIFWFGLASAGN